MILALVLAQFFVAHSSWSASRPSTKTRSVGMSISASGFTIIPQTRVHKTLFG